MPVVRTSFREPEDGWALCARCASLDMDEILSQSPQHWRFGRLIFRITEKRTELLKSSCSFCRLIAAVTPASTAESDLDDDFGLYLFQRDGRQCSYKDYGPMLGVARAAGGDQETSLQTTGCLLSTSPPDTEANPAKFRGRLLNEKSILNFFDTG